MRHSTTGFLVPWFRRAFSLCWLPRWPVLTLLLTTALATSAHAQEDRSLTSPIDWWWYDGVSPEYIGQVITENGARITDIEVEQTTPPRFTVVLVKNEGLYAKKWWWYYDLSGQGVARSVAQERARIADIELMAVRPDARFAVILVENSGEEAKLSNWTAGSIDAANAGDYISGLLESGMRLIDFDPNDRLGGYVTTVEVADKGTEAGGWWWYADATADELAQQLQEHDARLVDIEWKGATRFSALMVRSGGEAWWWYYDLTAQQVDELAKQNRARVIDIETRTVNGQKRFAAIMLQSRSLLPAQAAAAGAAAAAAAARPEAALAGRPELGAAPAAETPAGEAIAQIRPRPVPVPAYVTASGYICQIERTDATPSLRVTLTIQESCRGHVVADVIFQGDGEEGPLSKLGMTEQAMNTLKADGYVISIKYVPKPDGTNRAIEFSY